MVVVLLFVVAAIALLYGNQIAVTLGKSADMTGRAGIWRALFPEVWKRPILGFGYMAFFLGLKGESASLMMIPGQPGFQNAENSLLQMWLDLGAVGTLCTLVLLAKACRNAMRSLACNPTPYVKWNGAIVLLSMCMLIDGDKFMYPSTIEWLLFVIAYVNLADEARNGRGLRAARI